MAKTEDARKLLSSLRAELCVLGTILNNNSVYKSVETFLNPEHFSVFEHQLIFERMRILGRAGRLIDVVTVQEGLALDAEDALHLESLPGQEIPAEKAIEYAKVISDFYFKRNLVTVGENMITRAFSGDFSTEASYTQLADYANQISHMQAQACYLNGGKFIQAHEDFRNVEFIWPGRLVRGGINLLAGMGNVGKDVLACYIAATVSTGRNWADGRECEKGMVLYYTSEDIYEDTLGPRLHAAGADFNNIKIMNKSNHRLTPQDITSFSLVIMSPITDVFFGMRGNAYSNEDVRETLIPWREACQPNSTTVLGLCHYNKKNDLDPVQRILGSVGLVNFVRSVWCIEKDLEDEQTRLFLPLKQNLASSNDIEPMKFRIEQVGEFTQSITCLWSTDKVEVTADEIHNKKRKNAANQGDDDEEDDHVKPTRHKNYKPRQYKESRADAKTSAGDWLFDYLVSYDDGVNVIDIRADSELAGYEWPSIRKARIRDSRFIEYKSDHINVRWAVDPSRKVDRRSKA